MPGERYVPEEVLRAQQRQVAPEQAAGPAVEVPSDEETKRNAAVGTLRKIFEDIPGAVSDAMVAKFDEMLPEWEPDARRYSDKAEFWAQLAEAAAGDYLGTEEGTQLSEQLKGVDLDWQDMMERLGSALIEMRRGNIIDVRLREFKNTFYRLQRSDVDSHYESGDYDWFLNQPRYPEGLRKFIDFMRENGMTNDEKRRFARRVQYFNGSEDVEI